MRRAGGGRGGPNVVAIFLLNCPAGGQGRRRGVGADSMESKSKM